MRPISQTGYWSVECPEMILEQRSLRKGLKGEAQSHGQPRRASNDCRRFIRDIDVHVSLAVGATARNRILITIEIEAYHSCSVADTPPFS